MRLQKILLLAAVAALFAVPTLANAQLMITGVFDGPLTGGLPKGVELVALEDIADLSAFGIGSANNGGGTDGEEYTFPADAVSQGDVIIVSSDTDMFVSFFGFAPTYDDPGYAVSINGDDAVELFHNGVVIDTFGELDVDGTGTPWDHLDGWAYRVNGALPTGATFVLSDWIFSGVDGLEGGLTNDTCAVPYPLGTFTTEYNGVVANEAATLDGLKAKYNR